MAAFVLVHGAWGGAHGWRHVRRLLTAAGHDATAPSLTGIGERVHLVSPQVGLSTHVTDVVHHVLYEDLTDVVLVGFSYGGMVVTGALEHIGHRLGLGFVVSPVRERLPSGEIVVRRWAFQTATVPLVGQKPAPIAAVPEPEPLPEVVPDEAA